MSANVMLAKIRNLAVVRDTAHSMGTAPSMATAEELAKFRDTYNDLVQGYQVLCQDHAQLNAEQRSIGPSISLMLLLVAST